MSDRRRLHAFVPLAQLVLLAAVGCGSPPQPFVSDVDAVAIVERNSADAFMSLFDRSRDGEAFRTFDTRIATARSRADLITTWRTVPALVAKGADFLGQQVFAKSIAEHRWPKDRAPETMESVFVEGVHLGIRDFLVGR